MRLEGVVGDELGLRHDPVDALVLADELDVRGEAEALGLQPVPSPRDPLPDPLPRALADVGDEGREDLLLALEVGIEAAQRDPGPLGDAADGGVVEPALTEFNFGRLQQPVARLPAARGLGNPAIS